MMDEGSLADKWPLIRYCRIHVLLLYTSASIRHRCRRLSPDPMHLGRRADGLLLPQVGGWGEGVGGRGGEVGGGGTPYNGKRPSLNVFTAFSIPLFILFFCSIFLYMYILYMYS